MALGVALALLMFGMPTAIAAPCSRCGCCAPTYKIGLLASLLGRIGSGMLPFMTPLFLQVGMGFTPFHAGLMMIPMIIGSMGMKRIVVQVVNRFGYRNVLVAATLLLALVSLELPVGGDARLAVAAAGGAVLRG